MERVYYSYGEFIKDLKSLTNIINIEFDTILGVARGGLTFAHFLGEYYNIRKVYSINSIGYIDTKKLDNIEIFNIPDLSDSKNLLLVDDIVDSGDTIIKILDILREKYPNLNIYTASIFYKKSAKIKPNFYIKEPNGWIDFFWDNDLKKLLI